MRIWDLRSHTEIRRTVCRHGDRFQAVAYDPSGEFLVTGSDGVISFWDAVSLELKKEFSGHTGVIRTLLWNPGGNRLVTAAADATVRFWDLSTGQEVLRFDLPSRTMAIDSRLEMAFTADGKKLLAAEVHDAVLTAPGFGLLGELWCWEADSSSHVPAP